MPAYYFWGDDDFALQRAVQALRDRTLDPAWASFNYDVIGPEAPNGPAQALNQAMTPPFGAGQRLVWLQNTGLGQRCPEPVLAEFERTLPQIPDASVLLLTSAAKPDGRAKFTKLFKTHGEIREFATIPPWKTDEIRQQVVKAVQAKGLTLESAAVDLVAEAVGNDTRQLHLELDKLALYWQGQAEPLPAAVVAELVTISTQTSLQLAQAIKRGDTAAALGLVNDLLDRNEPALRIVATLVSQFRLWLWLKALAAAGVTNDAEVAAAAEVANPKRLYFLRQEVRSLRLEQLQQTLPLLLELESDLKQGREERATLHTKVMELCRVLRSDSP